MRHDRYLRHSMVDWFDQEILAKARVIVVGAGATGNEVLKNLSLLGIGHIHIIDYERIEIHNLTRAVLFSESDVGHYKADAAAKSCSRIDPNIEVTYSTDDFWQSLTIEDMKNCDALFCCIDNFEGRLKLNQLCRLAKVDFYDTAIDSRFVTAERYPFRTNSECACYECNLPASVYSRIRERYSCGWLRKRAFAEKKVPTTIITSSIAGAAVCSLYLHRSHESSPKDSVRYYTDTITLQSTVSLIPKIDHCPTCSTLPKDFQYFKVQSGRLLDTLKSCKAGNDVIIWLSDKVILDVICKKCGKKTVINDLAEKYDDALLYCDTCHMASNDVVIKDILTHSELKNTFANSKVPVKYLYLSQDRAGTILELEV